MRRLILGMMLACAVVSGAATTDVVERGDQ